MKRLSVFLLFCGLAHGQSMLSLMAAGGSAGGSAGIALVNGNNNALCTTSTTPPVDTRLANLFIIVTSKAAGGTGTPFDSLSNSYIGLTVRGATENLKIWYSLNPATSSATTFSAPPSGDTFPLTCATTFSGATAFDLESGAGSFGATTIQPGSITPSNPKELFVVGCAAFATLTGVDSGFTLSSSIAESGGSNYGTGVAFFIDTGTTTKNPTCTFASGVSAAAAMATFR